MKNPSSLILYICLISGIAGLARTVSADSGQALIQGTDTFILTLMSTNDLNGQIEPSLVKWDFNGDGRNEERECGGFARIAGTMEAVRSSSAGPAVLVSTGNDLMGRVFKHYHGKALIDLMNRSGYSILALGSHDFDAGLEVLVEALKNARFPVLASDLELEKSPLKSVCETEYILTHNRVNIGFFSLMTEEFQPATHVPIRLKSDNIQYAQQKVQELRARDVDIIVACTQIGFPRDIDLAEAVPDIDVIIGGHAQGVIPELVRVGSTLIIHAGERGYMMVRVDLPVTEFGTADPDHARHTVIPLDQHIPESLEVRSRVTEILAGLPALATNGRTEKLLLGPDGQRVIHGIEAIN